jgi:hypothetical protein
VIEPGEALLRVDLHRFLDYELWLRLRSRGVCFVHVPVVVAADRDHPQRKVRTTDALFAQESMQLVEVYGPVFGHSRFRRIRGLLWRLLGVAAVWDWGKHEPAFPWRTDGLLPRLVRQVARLDPVQLTAEERQIGRDTA